MAKRSVPRQRGAKKARHDFDSHIPQKIKDKCDRHLDRYIRRLWKDPDFLGCRQGFAGTQADLRQLRDTADPIFLTRYWRIIAGLVGIGGYDSAGHVPQPVPLGGWDEVFERVVDTILARLGLFRGREDNRQYRWLIAHMVIWPEEIHQAKQIREWTGGLFPYPFFVVPNVQDGKQVGRSRLTTEPDITHELQSVVVRIQRFFDDGYRSAPPQPHGSSAEAIERRARKREARLRAGKVAYELNQEHHTHTLDGILATQAFHDALGEAEMSISTPSAVSKLISEYKRSVGLGPRSRGRPGQD